MRKLVVSVDPSQRANTHCQTCCARCSLIAPDCSGSAHSGSAPTTSSAPFPSALTPALTPEAAYVTDAPADNPMDNDEGDEGNEGNEGNDNPSDNDEGDEGNEGNEGDEGDEGNEGNEGNEGVQNILTVKVN